MIYISDPLFDLLIKNSLMGVSDYKDGLSFLEGISPKY